MSKLQKRCVFVSAAMHGLLLLLLLVTPAFRPLQQQTEILPVANFIPAKLTDDASMGGGSPTAVPESKPPPTAPAPEDPPPQIKEPEPEPVKPPKKPDPEPPAKRTEEPKPKQPEPEETKTAKVKVKEPEANLPKVKDGELATTEKNNKPKPEKKIVVPTFELAAKGAKNTKDTKAAEREAAEAEAKAQAEARAQYKARLAAVQQALSHGLSQGTSITVPGPGGAFFANYKSVISGIFSDAWNPTGVPETTLTVKTEVVVHQSGKVIRARILSPSGNNLLDRSVQRALDSVRQVPAFPEGASDDQRIFNINFNLQSKRRSG